MKKIGKIILWIGIALVVLDLVIVGLLFVPPIQTFAVNKITQSLSKKWESEISIQRIHLTPSLKLVARGVRIADHHHNDMITAESVKGRLLTVTITPLKLKFGTLQLDHSEVVLRTYSGEKGVNISIWAQKFKKESNNKKDFLLTARHLQLLNTQFVLIKDDERIVFNTQGNPDIDYAFLKLSNIQLEADDFSVHAKDIVQIGMKFNHLSLQHYGGFTLQEGQVDFSICDTAMVFQNMHFVTPHSDLNLDLKFCYSQWSTLGDFVDSVRIISTIRPSKVSFQDIATWAPALQGMKETLNLTADRFDGTVNDFKLINFLARWGLQTRLHGDLALENVTNFENAHIVLSLDSSSVMIPELSNFTLPKGKSIPINSTIAQFGNTSLKGSFIGTPAEFNAQLDAGSMRGTFFANLSTYLDHGHWFFKGSVNSPNLNLGHITTQKKLFNSAHLFLSFDGDLDTPSLDSENLKTLKAHLQSDIHNIDLYGYPLQHTTFNGDYANQLYNGVLNFDDPNFDCNILAQLDLSEALPALQGNITLHQLNAKNIATKMHAVDSTHAKGFDKLLYAIKQNPKLQFSFSNFMVALRGNNLQNINGYAGCDNIRIISNEDSTENDRLRLTIINNERTHKYILSSGFANASIETNYPLQEVKNTLQSFAHNYFPTLINAAPIHTQKIIEENEQGYIKANLTTYRTRTITKLISPNLFIARNTTIDLALYDDHNMDKIEVNIPYFGLRNKLVVRNLLLHGNTKDSEHIQINLSTDSTQIVLGKNKLALENIQLAAQAQNDSIYYKLNWNDNLNNRKDQRSQLSGFANVSNAKDFIVCLKNSNIYLNDKRWQFNNHNAIHFQQGDIVVDSLRFFQGKSRIMVHGKYAKRSSEHLKVQVNNMDMAIANSLLNGMAIDGDISADITLICPQNKNIIFGKTFINDFTFNEAPIGDLFAIAGLDTANNVNFAGAIHPHTATLSENTLSNFSIRSIQNSPDRIAQIKGEYITEKHALSIHTQFDTLNAGFLGTFLSSFSHQFVGTASGNLSIYANPDSSYFEGNVRALDINMGIAPLGTTYNVKNQDITFTSQGIFFNKMQIKDLDGNEAEMTGSIKHKFFNDMDIDLNINTQRIQVLNTPKDPTSVFYGKGYVSGDIQIKNIGSTLTFRGPNITTLHGSKIVLQVTSASTTSQSDVIYFTPKKTNNAQPLEEVLLSKESKTKLDFDFTINVTNDADVVLFLESIGGTMNARADGKFQLLYNEDDLNLYGNIGIHSGDFRISLFNVVNSKFLLVPGGNIHFDGPLENMNVNVSAYKTAKTSLSEIIPAENIGNGVNVNAYLHLHGPLMQRIEPSFSFELPNSSEEVNNLFYTAIDTTNTENITKQFAYFLVTNNFMPASMFSSERTGSSLGASGINMFRNILNNMLGSIISSKNGSFGITYNQATETSSAEYGVTGSANLLKDRITVETSIGYYDDQNSQGINNMYGDFSVSYNINKSGTWKLKAYTYLGERDENYFLHNDQLNYTAGVALAYKQDFNTIHRKRYKTNKRKKTLKKDHK